jgi:hypothetical protein
MKLLAVLGGGVIALSLLTALGLKIKPAPFAPFHQPQPELETIPLPDNLPAPVERYYRQIYGERVPVITSAVLTGRATIKPFAGIPLPARFRFVHTAGQDYRHYIEATFYGLPVMRVNEHFLGGRARLELPTGISEGPEIDQAATLSMWAESIWLPAIWLTDPRVKWQAVDQQTAVLVVPFGEVEEQFIVRFDPDTGLVDLMESMRYQDAESGKILWLNQSFNWHSLNGYTLPLVGTATWLDQGKPWAIFTIEDVVYNVDVQEYVLQRGP